MNDLDRNVAGTAQAPFSPVSLDPAGVNDDPAEVGFTAIRPPAEHPSEGDPVTRAVTQVANVLKHSSERLSDARDQAVSVGRRHPVTTALTIFTVGMVCGIGSGVLGARWLAARRHRVRKSAVSMNDESSQIPVNVSVGSRCG